MSEKVSTLRDVRNSQIGVNISVAAGNEINRMALASRKTVSRFRALEVIRMNLWQILTSNIVQARRSAGGFNPTCLLWWTKRVQ